MEFNIRLIFLLKCVERIERIEQQFDIRFEFQSADFLLFSAAPRSVALLFRSVASILIVVHSFRPMSNRNWVLGGEVDHFLVSFLYIAATNTQLLSFLKCELQSSRNKRNLLGID